jgi:dolichyl-phosphate beta-glucosyltransferase
MVTMDNEEREKSGGPGQGLFLSIIVPAFNEGKRLSGSLERFVRFVEDQHYATEIIVVDNASDDSTCEITEKFGSAYPFIHYAYEPVRGKGAAVRNGMLKAEGEYLLICDADLAVPVDEVNKLFAQENINYDILIGSREAEGAVRRDEPFYRHVMGRAFNLLVRMLLLPGIRDSQCGFKMFKREIAQKLFRRLETTGWSFDVEILFRARLLGFSMLEVPVTWYYGKHSKINPFKDTINMFVEILRIRLKRKRYLLDDPGR